ncbi:unnamed protein product [Amoebophrya sp. A25]|nr:unnamed protein product [Amoebophrya sp. A25]|eukprot:GSA25T00012644001.1
MATEMGDSELHLLAKLINLLTKNCDPRGSFTCPRCTGRYSPCV